MTNQEKTKILVEVSGGCVQGIRSLSPKNVDVVLVDYDNLEEFSPDPEAEAHSMTFEDGTSVGDFLDDIESMEQTGEDTSCVTDSELYGGDEGNDDFYEPDDEEDQDSLPDDDEVEEDQDEE